MIRAPIPDLSPGERRLEGAVAHYLARVLRLRAGDAFIAFDPATGSEAGAVTEWTDQDTITVHFGPLRPGLARPAHELTWIQGMAKGDRCDGVVRDATELGVARILFALTRRSVVRLDATRANERLARWARIAKRGGAPVRGRSDVPLIEAPCLWGEALARAVDGNQQPTRGPPLRGLLALGASDCSAGAASLRGPGARRGPRLRVRTGRGARGIRGGRGAIRRLARGVARSPGPAYRDGRRRSAGRGACVERS